MKMTYRHLAYNVATGEIINAPTGAILNRAVATNNRISRKYGFKGISQWRFCHDSGKRWQKNGLPQR